MTIIRSIPFALLQLTAANGALCFINPLYLQEHGDDWLTQTSVSTNLNNRPFISKRERRLSTARAWMGAGLKKRTESVEESSASFDSSGDTKVSAKFSVHCSFTTDLLCLYIRP